MEEQKTVGQQVSGEAHQAKMGDNLSSQVVTDPVTTDGNNMEF